MGQRSTTEIIESVIQVTEHRDRDLLEATLVSTLYELIGARSISLHKITISNGCRGLRETARMDASGLISEQTSSSELQGFVALEAAVEFADCLAAGAVHVLRDPSGDGARYLHPLWNSKEIAGFLDIVSHRVNEIDKKLIEGFLKIYRNYLCLLDDSEHDTLTGLLNRGAFDKNLDKILLGKAITSELLVLDERRKSLPNSVHWLAVVDIDYFKRINDQFGHLHGDEVLVHLAGVMRKTLRSSDRLFRFGGEEFVILLKPTDFENAQHVFERLRSTVESYNFPQVGKVTVSIGFVRIDSHDIPSLVVGHADMALYYAKQAGRNQICSYENLIDEGKLDSASYSFDADYFCPTDSCPVGFAGQ